MKSMQWSQLHASCSWSRKGATASATLQRNVYQWKCNQHPCLQTLVRRRYDEPYLFDKSFFGQCKRFACDQKNYVESFCVAENTLLQVFLFFRECEFIAFVHGCQSHSLKTQQYVLKLVHLAVLFCRTFEALFIRCLCER